MKQSTGYTGVEEKGDGGKLRRVWTEAGEAGSQTAPRIDYEAKL